MNTVIPFLLAPLSRWGSQLWEDAVYVCTEQCCGFDAQVIPEYFQPFKSLHHPDSELVESVFVSGDNRLMLMAGG